MLHINKEQNDSTLVFLLEGSVDTNTAPKLDAALEGVFSEVSAVIIDLGGVRYVSSAGLRVFLKAQKAAIAHGKSLKLVAMLPMVYEVFAATGISDLMTIERA